MAGKIIADTLEHSTAGSVTTDYVVEGSAKVLCRIDTYTPTDTPSFNVSSLADNGTGDATVNFTNGFNGTNSYHPSGFSSSSNFIANQVTRATAASTAYPANNIRVYSMNDAGSAADTYGGSLTIHGDLA